MITISEKIIWITGASSGIGEALAIALSKQDNRLILSARNAAALENVKSQCHHPEKVAVLPLDLSEFETIPTKVVQAVTLFGSIDILVNNGGSSQRSLVKDTSLDVYRKLMNVNYLGTIHLTTNLLPYFIKKKTGYFVVTSSLMGKFGAPLRAGYCGSKHALHGFFDVLRLEHEKDNIHVSLICPGYVNTAIAKNALLGSGEATNLRDQENEQGISADECARQIIIAIANKKHEVYIGGNEKYGVYLKRFFPKLLNKMLQKTLKKK